MKLLHLIPYFVRAYKTGGPAMQLSRLANAEQSLGNKVSIVTTTGNLDEEVDITFSGDTIEVLEQGLPTVYFKRKTGLLPRTYYYAPHLDEWLELHLPTFDIVIIHGIWTYFSSVGASICRRIDKPYLIFLHGSLDPWALNHRKWKKWPYWSLIEKRNLQKSAGVIALSQDEADQARGLGVKRPSYLAKNGVMFPVKQVVDPALVLESSLSDLGPNPFILYLSRLHPKKGVDMLLRAWAKVREQYPDWRLVIAGPDECGYLAKLQLIVDQLGLSQSVRFPGLVQGDFKAALFQKASVFVLPSHSEGVPGAVIEALAYGLPVIITPGCHLPEIAKANAGLIVWPKETEIATGLQQMMSNSYLRQEMGRNAKNLACTEFDEMKVAAGLVNFCQELLLHYKNK